MTKGEFLTTLRSKLTGEIPPDELEKDLMYYEEYITDEMRKGRSEEEILNELGSPLLIARTLIDTQPVSEEKQGYGSYNHNEQRSQRRRNGPTQEEEQSEEETQRGSPFRRRRRGLMMILIVFLVISLFSRVLWYILPTVFPILLIVFFLMLFRRR